MYINVFHNQNKAFISITVIRKSIKKSFKNPQKYYSENCFLPSNSSNTHCDIISSIGEHLNHLVYFFVV